MPFNDREYLIRRKVLKLFGGAFHIYNAAGQVVGYTKMEAFKLKEELRMYTSEDMRQPLFSIQARNVLDISATYDVFEETGNGASASPIGALRRRGLKSVFKDEWLILDPQGLEIGKITEDNLMLALVRRFLTNLVPQRYDCEFRGRPAVWFRQNFNPFVMKIRVIFLDNDLSSRTLLMAAGILLCAIEGKQN